MFNQIGFFKEYYVNGKFIGSVSNCEKDRDVIGYEGKIIETLKESIITDNKKKIKENTTVTTILYPLCGKLNK